MCRLVTLSLSLLKNGQPVTTIDIVEGGTIDLIFKDDSGAAIADSIPVRWYLQP
jgi:hypothetical protein